MAGIEILVLLVFLLAKGKGAAPAVPGAAPGTTPVPSVPVPGPAITPPRTAPAATAPPPGVPATTQQAQQVQRAQAAPQPFPQTVPPGLPPFPGPAWRPWSPVPSAVATRASQLLPVLWRSGAGTRKQEMTSGAWTTYVATQMGQLHGVTAHKLVTGPGPLANA